MNNKNTTNLSEEEIRGLIAQMTPQEKVSVLSGVGSWYTQEIERLDIPAVMVSDGPHGLRKQGRETDHMGINDSIETVCFPAACVTACSFDRELLYEMGTVLGRECQSEDVAVILGPAVNIKRSPLCGRNFEYFSEDPYAAGELSSAYIRGVQSQGVGTSIKHFAANNQEHERMNSSSEVDERTFREIYLPAFETAVKEAQPWTVMCSYNRINGVYASENPYLLTRILREEWGYEGFVMSDWGAVSDRVKGVAAGLDLEMPGSDGANDPLLLQALEDGTLSTGQLDEAVYRILKIVLRYRHDETAAHDLAGDHEKAAQIARESIVLLKNEQVLPLSENEKVFFTGCYADSPRYQGGGSSHVNAYRVVSACEAVKKYADVCYAPGFTQEPSDKDAVLAQEALHLAEGADKIVVFAGLPETYESEGYDRKHMDLPPNQNALIEALSSLGKPVIVVLHNGSPVLMPWEKQVAGIVEAYLCGEAVGEAVTDILYGRANPCGKLAETFPLRLEDTPTYLEYPGLNQKAVYAEGIFIGYRYYDKKKMPVCFPFGHGLSYTTFAYSNLRAEKDETGADNFTVCADITNTGSCSGKEIVQLYITDESGMVSRPERELKQFAAVVLEPGETKTVQMRLGKRAFQWYDAENARWYAAPGSYRISLGSSSRDIRLQIQVEVSGDGERPLRIDKDVMFGDLLSYSKTADFVRTDPDMRRFMAGFTGEREKDKENEEMLARMVGYMPLRALRSFSGMDNEDLQKMVEKLRDIR